MHRKSNSSNILVDPLSGTTGLEGSNKRNAVPSSMTNNNSESNFLKRCWYSPCCERLQRCFCTTLRFLNTFAVAILTVVVIFLFMQLQYITYYVRTVQEEEIKSLRHDVEQKQTQQIQYLNEKVEQQNNFTLYQMAGTFTLLTCLLTMFHITHHVRNYFEPIIQRKIIAILWMSPIYSITSFLSLIIPVMEGYLAIFKDFYEAYVIYTFLSFLIAVLGRGNRQVVVNILARRARHLKNPYRCLSRFYYPPPETSNEAKANAVLLECQILAMQFVFIRPITSIARFLIIMIQQSQLENYNDLDSTSSAFLTSGSVLDDDSKDDANRFLRAAMDSLDGNRIDIAKNATSALNITSISMASAQDVAAGTWNYFTSPYFIIAMITNISVFLAFTGLLKFYHAVQEDLSWCQPFNKFITIKGIVFLTFWQGLAINIFVSLRPSTTLNEKDDNDLSATLKALEIQNVLICLEMLFFSIAHWCVFPAEEMDPNYKRPTKNIEAGFGLQDFISDLRMIKTSAKKRKHIKKLLKQEQKRKKEKDQGELLSEYDFLNDSSVEEDIMEFCSISDSFDYNYDIGDNDDADNSSTCFSNSNHEARKNDIFCDEYSDCGNDDHYDENDDIGDPPQQNKMENCSYGCNRDGKKKCRGDSRKIYPKVIGTNTTTTKVAARKDDEIGNYNPFNNKSMDNATTEDNNNNSNNDYAKSKSAKVAVYTASRSSSSLSSSSTSIS